MFYDKIYFPCFSRSNSWSTVLRPSIIRDVMGMCIILLHLAIFVGYGLKIKSNKEVDAVYIEMLIASGCLIILYSIE